MSDIPATIPVLLARDMASLLAEGVTEPADMLARLHETRNYQWISLPEVARQMRALTGDTTKLARQIVRARSAQTMLEVLEDGEPKDKIQVLRSWGPEVNAESSDGPRVIVQIGVSNGDVQVAFAPSHTETERKSAELLDNTAGSDNVRYVNQDKDAKT